MTFTPDDSSLSKILISFWCRRGLNPRSLIQPSETLPVELTERHKLNLSPKKPHHPFFKCEKWPKLLQRQSIQKNQATNNCEAQQVFVESTKTLKDYKR